MPGILGHQQLLNGKMKNFQKIKSFISNNKFPILIFFGLSFIISLTFPTGFSIRYSYQLNDIAKEPIIAPFDFGILKTNQKLNKDLDQARNSVPFSFSRDQDFVNKQISDIDTFFIYLNDIYNAHELFISSQDSLYKYRYETDGIFSTRRERHGTAEELQCRG